MAASRRFASAVRPDRSASSNRISSHTSLRRAHAGCPERRARQRSAGRAPTRDAYADVAASCVRRGAIASRFDGCQEFELLGDDRVGIHGGASDVHSVHVVQRFAGQATVRRGQEQNAVSAVWRRAGLAFVIAPAMVCKTRGRRADSAARPEHISDRVSQPVSSVTGAEPARRTPGGTSDHGLGVGRRVAREGFLEVAVEALGSGDLGVAELALDVHQRAAGG